MTTGEKNWVDRCNRLAVCVFVCVRRGLKPWSLYMLNMQWHFLECTKSRRFGTERVTPFKSGMIIRHRTLLEMYWDRVPEWCPCYFSGIQKCVKFGCILMHASIGGECRVDSPSSLPKWRVPTSDKFLKRSLHRSWPLVKKLGDSCNRLAVVYFFVFTGVWSFEVCTRLMAFSRMYKVTSLWNRTCHPFQIWHDYSSSYTIGNVLGSGAWVMSLLFFLYTKMCQIWVYSHARVYWWRVSSRFSFVTTEVEGAHIG